MCLDFKSSGRRVSACRGGRDGTVRCRDRQEFAYCILFEERYAYTVAYLHIIWYSICR